MRNYLPDAFISQIGRLDPSKDVSDRDTMMGKHKHERHYFGVGKSALLLILSALASKMSYYRGEVPPKNILDFGSGYGRVARWLRAAFPDAEVDVTDYDKGGPVWCIEQLGCCDMGLRTP